jgi:hypothetical protein
MTKVSIMLIGYILYVQNRFDINDDNISTYFNPAIRSRIVHFILRRKRYSEDEKDNLAMGYERLVNSKAYLAAYPLHDVKNIKFTYVYSFLIIKKFKL